MRYTEVTFSWHAREQMALRNVSPSQVKRTLTAPTRLYPSTAPPGRLIAERETELGNVIRVVYVERERAQDTTAHVVTVIRISPRRRA